MNTGFIILLFFLLSATGTQAAQIRIAASDLLSDFITPPLKAYAGKNDLDFKLEGIGSLPALDRLRSDEIDLAIIAVPESEEVPRDEFKVYPFAYDTAIVAVNKNNPINKISIPHLAGIFGSDEEFNFNTWGELGLSGWGSRNIKPLAGPSQESISLELFRYSVFSRDAMKSSLAVLRDTEIEEALAGNIAAIGILSSLPENKDLKVLMISDGDSLESPAYRPTAENIHLGDYPIRLAFYIAYNPRDEEKVRPMLRALLADEISQGLSKNHLFALPGTVRNQLLVDLNFQ